MKKNKVNTYMLKDRSLIEFKESISNEDIDKINKFTVSPVESKDIKVYTALLIDDKVTRNGTVYNKEFQLMLLSLPVGEGNFIGAPILFGDTKDHQHAANAQVGRIFEAEQVIDDEGHYGVLAKLYVLVSDENNDLIKKIDNGILKEMSISTKVELPICSTCGQDIRECDHIVGRDECHVVMSGSGFVAETSFVAVPGSNAAKILNDDDVKKFLKLEDLKNVISPLIQESLHANGVVFIEASGVKRFAEASGVPSNETFTEQLTTIATNYEEIKTLITDLSYKISEAAAEAADRVKYPIDMYSNLNRANRSIGISKAFVIENLAKQGLELIPFDVSPIGELTQGLKDVDILRIVGVFLKNTGILDTNLIALETKLGIEEVLTIATYDGDANNVQAVLQYVIDALDNINVRILKLKGRFDLELKQRNELIKEAIKYGMITNKFKFNNKELSEKFFENFTTEEIVKLKDEFFEEGSKIFINKEIKKPKPIEKKPTNVKKLSPREIAKNILNKEK